MNNDKVFGHNTTLYGQEGCKAVFVFVFCVLNHQVVYRETVTLCDLGSPFDSSRIPCFVHL